MVKRKRSEAAVGHSLRSGRIVKPTGKNSLRSSQSPGKSPRKEGLKRDAVAQYIEGEDSDFSRTERPLKIASPFHLRKSTVQILESGDSGTHSHSIRNPNQYNLDDTLVSHDVTVPHRVAHDNSNTDESSIFSTQLPFCLQVQKKEILRMLQTNPSDNLLVPNPEAAAQKQLSDLIQGSITRGEGNSCIVLGPRGSVNTRIVDKCLHDLAIKPILIRLTGCLQTTDKKALREIATQLLHQTGACLISDTPPDSTFADDDENPFIERPKVVQDIQGEQIVQIPISSQLHALIPVLLSLKRPVVVILDDFDLFALHPRQSLLYCLLDAAQSCRSTSGSNGIAIIGFTSRIDTVHLLEKRVKSRFSGRIIRSSSTNELEHWITFAKNVLLAPITLPEPWLFEKWEKHWSTTVQDFLSDSRVLDAFRETFEISRDVKVLIRLLTHSVLHLKPSKPHLSYNVLSDSVNFQRSRPRCTSVHHLSYPMVCLIIASIRVEISGHTTFSFEMLFEKFRDQVRASTSAPVQLSHGQVGMVKCTRRVLLAAFDQLVSSHVFLPCVRLSAVARDFIKHRCVMDREVIKQLVETSGQIHLKRWFNTG